MRSRRTVSMVPVLAFTLGACAAGLNQGAPVIPPDGWVVQSPGGLLTVQIRGCSLGGTADYPAPPRLYYRVTLGAEHPTEVLRWSPLGITRADADFTDDLRYLGETQRRVTDDYVLPRGKRSHFRNSAIEHVLSFQTPQKVRMDLIVRAYDDGFAFRYDFPETNSAQFSVTAEATGFRFMPGARVTLLPLFAPGVGQAEGGLGEWITDLPAGTAAPTGAGWALPALFSAADGAYWALLAESGLAAGHAALGLAGKSDDEIYRFRFPHPDEEAGQGDVQPHSSLPWSTPWRVVILSDRLAGIVESSLVTDLGAPARAGAGDWIPAENLLIRDAASKMAGPKNAAASPLAEFAVAGLKGVRIAVSSSGKPDVVASLLARLEEAGQRHWLVELAGRIAGAGWDRTYPYLLSSTTWPGSRSADNGVKQARQNLIDPFTRNVVGPMQPMPVAFGDQARRSPMTFGHGLGLTVVFESGLRRFVDGDDAIPKEAVELLANLPTAWDETRLLDGDPGHTVIIARRRDRAWYLGGLNGDAAAKTRAVPLELLGTGIFNMVLLADGYGETDLVVTKRQRNATDVQGIKMAPYGGFLMRLVPEH